MTVGFIGSGRIGSSLALLSVAAGQPVVLSNSRGPQTLAKLADQLGPLATACNYNPLRDGQIAELDNHSVTSSELIQRHLPDAKVVKAFNNIFFRHLLALSRPAGSADRSYLPIAGDDAAAKATVTAYLDTIGFWAVDDGSLADSWRLEPRMPVYGPPSQYGPLTDDAGIPAGEAQIRAAIAAARR
jgi:hypothetical protein